MKMIMSQYRNSAVKKQDIGKEVVFIALKKLSENKKKQHTRTTMRLETFPLKCSALIFKQLLHTLPRKNCVGQCRIKVALI